MVHKANARPPRPSPRYRARHGKCLAVTRDRPGRYGSLSPNHVAWPLALAPRPSSASASDSDSESDSCGPRAGRVGVSSIGPQEPCQWSGRRPDPTSELATPDLNPARLIPNRRFRVGQNQPLMIRVGSHCDSGSTRRFQVAEAVQPHCSEWALVRLVATD